jgi:hypothetical protein
MAAAWPLALSAAPSAAEANNAPKRFIFVLLAECHFGRRRLNG